MDEGLPVLVVAASSFSQTAAPPSIMVRMARERLGVSPSKIN